TGIRKLLAYVAKWSIGINTILNDVVSAPIWKEPIKIFRANSRFEIRDYPSVPHVRKIEVRTSGTKELTYRSDPALVFVVIRDLDARQMRIAEKEHRSHFAKASRMISSHSTASTGLYLCFAKAVPSVDRGMDGPKRSRNTSIAASAP